MWALHDRLWPPAAFCGWSQSPVAGAAHPWLPSLQIAECAYIARRSHDLLQQAASDTSSGSRWFRQVLAQVGASSDPASTPSSSCLIPRLSGRQ